MSVSENRLIIGTRGSKLALIQTGLVADALKHQRPGLVIETEIIKTTGDLNQAPIPLDMIGKSWFTAEIEQALLNGEIDIAVHSLKDMSLEPVAGLETMVVLERADPRDVLISKSDANGQFKKLDELVPGAIIGTDSVRRKMLVLDRRPDLVVKSVRGNVDTRLKKLHAEPPAEQYDALVLAAAGLERLGILDVVTEFFDPETFLPVSGQGVLAVQIRDDKVGEAKKGESGLRELLRSIEHMPTRIASEAELAFSRAIGAGCKTPIGCYAQIEGEAITIKVVIEHPDTHKVVRKSTAGPATEAVRLAQELAKSFL